LPKLDKSSIGRLSNTVLADEQYLHVQCLKDSSKEQISLLNEEQKKVYEVVLDSVHNNSGKLFFLYVPGGTGKTFVYNTIINKLRSETNIVIPVATSGIAALLLPGGRTAHSRFKIPLNLFDDSVCDITCGTMLADLLIQAKLIIWDEAPMTSRLCFEALDRTLRDVLSIHNENNAVMVTGQAVGETLFYGPGAGGLPTANSVLSDIVSVTKNIVLGTTGNTFNNYQHESEPIDKSNVIYPYYLSLQMKDIPGQILKVTKLMTEIGASFSQIVQTKANDTEARVIFITHSMSKEQLKTLKEEIAKFDSISLNAAYKVLEN